MVHALPWGWSSIILMDPAVCLQCGGECRWLHGSAVSLIAPHFFFPFHHRLISHPHIAFPHGCFAPSCMFFWNAL
ncbi:hypothetical protein QBC36DRAFT_323744 [Triangularia setosa]|uniref:Secreted protein n=1 Tax=Triangularia setosa TaxID=2587417 RepID=A0AAN6WC35_9PEZI|nr:hypothetical protein QBC36DRAFT_323744 [Podospora setosa]